jgi:Leucine-rich repeat (LRR) protein
MNDNLLDEIPASLGDLESLKSLSLRGNKLHDFPEIFYRWTALTELVVSNNRLAQLQLQFEVLTRLDTLGLEGNLLVSPPREVLQQGTPTTLEYIRRLRIARDCLALDMSSFGLVGLPAEVLEANTRITSLKLSGNRLRTLPPELRVLRGLQILICDGNALSELPSEIGQCTALTALNAAANHLRSLPSSVGRLSNLTSLLIGDNDMSSLPPDLKRLTKIVELQVIILLWVLHNLSDFRRVVLYSLH